MVRRWWLVRPMVVGAPMVVGTDDGGWCADGVAMREGFVICDGLRCAMASVYAGDVMACLDMASHAGPATATLSHGIMSRQMRREGSINQSIKAEGGLVCDWRSCEGMVVHTVG